MRLRCAVLGVSLVTGCGLSHPQTGSVVSAGVGLATFETRTNATDLVDVDVLFPADESGHPLGSNLPALVFVQGGLVSAEQYRWQAERLAAKGYVVALPLHLFELAFFQIDNGAAAHRLLVAPPASLLSGLVDDHKVAVAGHSLGGVVAVKLALEGLFQALVLEASYPDTADDASVASMTIPSLSLAGTLDCNAKLAVVEAGWAKLPSPTTLVELAGMTHYQFTGDQTPDEKANCLPDGTLDDAHARVATALTSFLGTALEHRPVDTTTLSAISGATVQTR